MDAEQPTTHPGKVLLDEVMAPLGVSRAQLARDLDVPIGRLRAIVLGQHAITADMALRLAKHFGTTPELWMKLQSDYDLATARAAAWPAIEPRIRVFGEEPAAGDAPPEAEEPTEAPDAAAARIEPFVALPTAPLVEPEAGDRIEPFVALPAEAPAALDPGAVPEPSLAWPEPVREEEVTSSDTAGPAFDPFPPADAVPPMEVEPSAEPLPPSDPLPPMDTAEPLAGDELPVLELTERIDVDGEEEPLELTQRVDDDDVIVDIVIPPSPSRDARYAGR